MYHHLCVFFALLAWGTLTATPKHTPKLRCGTCENMLASPHRPQHHISKSATSKVHTIQAEENTYIDLLIVYDDKGKAIAEAAGGITPHVEQIITRSNRVMNNSGIKAQFRCVGTYHWPQEIESLNQGLDLGITHLLNALPIEQKRRETQADIVIICSEPLNNGHYGIAISEADATTAVASVRASAAHTSYTVAHEIGHIFGCQHSRESFDKGVHEYAVGATRAPYYTVMGFGDQEGLTERIPIFSGPTSVWQGVVMGSETENCVRKINERLAEVSQFSTLSEVGYQLNRTTWEIDHLAHSTDITLTTNTFYFIKSSAPWLKASKNNGFNTTTFTLYADANPTATTRTATLTIEGDEKFDAATIHVTQSGHTTAIHAPHTTTPRLTWHKCILGAQIERASLLSVYTANGYILYQKQLDTGKHSIALDYEGALIVRVTNDAESHTYRLLAP